MPKAQFRAIITAVPPNLKQILNFIFKFGNGNYPQTATMFFTE